MGSASVQSKVKPSEPKLSNSASKVVIPADISEYVLVLLCLRSVSDVVAAFSDDALTLD